MSDASEFEIENGVLTDYKGSDVDVVVPDGVTSIGYAAFDWCINLTSITLPDGVTNIGNAAFNNCSSLTSVTLPESVTSIGNMAFNNCSSLKSITLPESVTSIGNWAFSGCSSLTSITLPDSVTSIGNDAFKGTAVLEDESRWENGVLYIGNHLIKARDSISGDYVIREGTRSIATEAFSDCSNLKSITLPESVTSIGDHAFSHCSNLTNIMIPDSVTRIGSSAFNNCEKLADPEGFVIIRNTLYGCFGPGGDVVIPAGVTSIGDSAFLDCSSLTSITIPDSVTEIGREVFWCCSSLTSITIPDSVTSIGGRAFYNCSSLESITIPAGVTSIGNEAFLDCSSLKSVAVPDSVTEIGAFAFCQCRNLADKQGFIIVKGILFEYTGPGGDIVIPENVTSIGDSAFRNCRKLTSVSIPDGVAGIGMWAFYGCSQLAEATILGRTKIDPTIFEKCDSLAEITAPVIPHAEWREANLGKQAAVGFIRHSERFTDPEITAEYVSYLSSQKKKLLPVIFEADADGILRLLAEAKKITKKNYEQDYLLPAMQCKAEKCTAYLQSLGESFGQTGKAQAAVIKGREFWDGVHFSLDGKKLLKYPGGSDSEIYAVPEGTIEICTCAFDREPLSEIVLPESVDYIRSDAFLTDSKRTLLVRLPAELKSVSRAAFGIRVYILVRDKKIAEDIGANGSGTCIYTGGPVDDLTVKARSSAVKGFLYASERGMPEIEPWRESYLAYIKRNEKTYRKQIFLEKNLFGLMLEEKLLTESGVRALLPEAENRPEIMAALLEYRNKHFAAKKQKDDLDLSDNDPQMKRMLKMAERQEQIKGQKGIKGLAFVSTGWLKNFGYIDEYTGAHDFSDLKAYIEERGGFYRGSVSSKTDYLICNDPDRNSTKSRKAKELGVPMITEEEFLKMAEEK